MKEDTVPRSFLVALLIVAGGLLLRSGFFTAEHAPQSEPSASALAATAFAARPALAYGPPLQVSGEVKRGDVLAAVMTRSGLEPDLAYRVIEKLRAVFDPRHAQPGDSFTAQIGPETTLLDFEYECATGDCYRVHPAGDELAAQHIPLVLETRIVRREGVLENSLFGAIREAGGGGDEVVLFADVFSGSFDFFTESRKGDRFNYLVEGFYADGELHRTGRVLLAEYVSELRDKSFTGVFYQNPESPRGGYYTTDGKPLSRRFLRSPLSYSRISSRFSHSRFHPILKTHRPHLGVDYAAPQGTPVSAVADGVVVLAGRNGGLGNCVKLRHSGRVSTTYGHLSRYGRGIKKGSRVEQGEVIGYVGSTGLSTGPHLDFRIERNGVFVDPLRFESEAGPPLPASQMDDFIRTRDQLLRLQTELPLNVPTGNAQFAQRSPAAPEPPSSS